MIVIFASGLRVEGARPLVKKHRAHVQKGATTLPATVPAAFTTEQIMAILHHDILLLGFQLIESGLGSIPHDF
jgi:hypothetical protein